MSHSLRTVTVEWTTVGQVQKKAGTKLFVSADHTLSLDPPVEGVVPTTMRRINRLYTCNTLASTVVALQTLVVRTGEALDTIARARMTDDLEARLLRELREQLTGPVPRSLDALIQTYETNTSARDKNELAVLAHTQVPNLVVKLDEAAGTPR